MSDTHSKTSLLPPLGHHRRSPDTLVIAWLHGVVSACILRKAAVSGVWKGVATALTVEDFTAQLDLAITGLGFDGTDVCLILAHPDFTLRPESTPALAEKAARAFLQSKLDRQNAGAEAPLSISQAIYSTKKELAFLVHQLPGALYREINTRFLERKLELTRVLPAVVPLQVLVAKLDIASDKAAVVAAECGRSVVIVVIRGDGHLLLARNLQADWRSETERIAAEANRSALYSKQQFSSAVEHVILLGADNPDLLAHAQARCAKGVTVSSKYLSATDFPAAVAKVPIHHPVNLLAAFLTRRRNIQNVRRGLIAACWFGVVLTGLSLWNDRLLWSDTIAHFKALKSREPALRTEREMLATRNRAVERDLGTIQQLVDGKRPPAPAQLLVHLAGNLPRELEFTDFSARVEPGTLKGAFRIEGQVHADEELAQEIMATWVRSLAQDPLRIRIPDTPRSLVAAPVPIGSPPLQRFSIEGGFLDE